MLTLSRQTHQEVIIETPEGRKIRVAVVQIDGGRVRLGFDADKEVKIHRRELVEPNPTNGAAQ